MATLVATEQLNRLLSDNRKFRESLLKIQEVALQGFETGEEESQKICQRILDLIRLENHRISQPLEMTKSYW